MTELKYGLNITKKPGLPRLADRPAPRKTIFDEDDEDSGPEDRTQQANEPQEITTLGGLEEQPMPGSSKPTSKPHSSAPSGPPKRKAPQISQYGDLSSQRISSKQAATAQELDYSVYDYDAVYETLHAKPAKSSKDSAVGPKYMTGLMAAAEVRKRDQLRAKEKTLQREREAEGEEFAGKEKFVTGAYRQQQEEMRKVEEEEKRKEEEEMEKKRRNGGGMTALYKDLLGREDERHEAAMRAQEEVKARREKGEEVAEDAQAGLEKSEADVAKERGAVVNEEGQVVDKRQLLSAGLNVVAKPKQKVNEQRANVVGSKQDGRDLRGNNDAKQAMRERQTRMLEQQLEEATKRAAEDEQSEREALERANKRRTTEKDVSSARERYLARKREAEEATRKKQAAG